MIETNGLRFIIGSGCNYNCFYCHHEGCKTKDNLLDLNDYENKIIKLKEMCKANNIKDIAITGGEPFLYYQKLCIILKHFLDDTFNVVINTNASLISKYKDEISKWNKVEFHINLSTLNKARHKKIINTDFFEKELESLDFLSTTKHAVRLNIICLKTLNDDELIKLYDYCKNKNFEARYLVFYDCDKTTGQYVLTEEEICEKLRNHITKRHSYGLIETEGEHPAQIVKCLCIDNECEKCKQTTYLHISPKLNIKYCMNLEDEVEIDYSNKTTIEESFKKAIKKLKEI